MSLDRSAHAMRSAARDLVHTATGPDGSALAALVAALVTRRWHEVKNHARQAVAARQAVRHLQAAADMALAPTLAALRARRPRDQARRVFANEVRAAVPDHTERILADLAWPRSPRFLPTPKPAATSLTDSSRKPPPSAS